MISIWHLFWIIPLSTLFGIFLCALCHAASSPHYCSDDTKFGEYDGTQ